MPTLHLREQLMVAITAALTGLSTTGTRVYVGRTSALGESASPSLLIDYGPEHVEPAEILHGRNRTLKRDFEVQVRGAVKAVSGYLTTLNAIALEVETALAAVQSLGGLSKSVQLTGIDEPELDGQGEKTVAVMLMRFNVNYMAALNAPQTAR